MSKISKKAKDKSPKGQEGDFVEKDGKKVFVPVFTKEQSKKVDLSQYKNYIIKDFKK